MVEPERGLPHSQLSHIVGFEIAVDRIEAKFKLSQNRTRQEQQNIIDYSAFLRTQSSQGPQN